MYNEKNPLGFIPKRNPKATSRRSIKPANIGEPSTRLPPAPKSRFVDYGENHEEMLAREAKAQAEIERKKLCTAPAYNKGAYQYISDEEQAKMVGR